MCPARGTLAPPGGGGGGGEGTRHWVIGLGGSALGVAKYARVAGHALFCIIPEAFDTRAMASNAEEEATQRDDESEILSGISGTSMQLHAYLPVFARAVYRDSCISWPLRLDGSMLEASMHTQPSWVTDGRPAPQNLPN